MARARAALGPALVNLASGDPDLPTPPHICAAAVRAIEAGATHYTPKNGMPELREAISVHLESFYSLRYGADEICVTAGVQEALASCFLALTGAGDEVLVPSPTYLSYEKQGALLGGATVVPVPCRPEADFIVQPADIEAALTPRSNCAAGWGWGGAARRVCQPLRGRQLQRRRRGSSVLPQHSQRRRGPR
jgi:aspartate/methionine/tyrosine aminotransferase